MSAPTDARHAVGDALMLPRGLAGPAATWTRLGTLDGTVRPLVDAAGLVSPGPGRPSIDWWIGADDRWHLPSAETTVRQSRIRATPVVETAMRVPGGDALHRVCVVRLPSAEGGGDALLMEVENRTGTPFALALALRPFDAVGPVAVHTVSMSDGALVADGRTALLLAKAPNRAVAGGRDGGDLLEVIRAGGAHDATFEELHDPSGLAQSVFVVPVPHRVTFRAVIPLDVDLTSYPGVLPTAADVAEGWRVQLRDAARVGLPDTARGTAFDALPGALVLAASEAASGTLEDQLALAEALATVGFTDQATAVLAGVLLGIDDASIFGRSDAALEHAAAVALGRHLQRQPDADLARAGLELAVRAAQRQAEARRPGRLFGRRRPLVPVTAEAQRDVAALLTVMDQAGEARAAADTRTMLAALHVEDVPAAVPPGVGDELDALLAEASSAVSWPGRTDWAPAARATNLLVASLVRADPDAVAVAAEVPEAWLGQNFEVHGFRTPAGVVSFAVRWHAERPALLWEVVDGEAPLAITAPGLDQGWTSGDPAGEALLSPVALPEHPVPGAPGGGVVIDGLQIGRRPPSGDIDGS